MSKEKEYFKLTPEMLEPVSVVLQSSMHHWEGLPNGLSSEQFEEMIYEMGMEQAMRWLAEECRNRSKDKTDS